MEEIDVVIEIYEKCALFEKRIKALERVLKECVKVLKSLNSAYNKDWKNTIGL